MRPLAIKVCGMRQADNIQALAELDIDYMGFIFYEKSKRYTPTSIITDLPASIKKVGVFVNASVEDVQNKINEGLHAVQLHGDESVDFCKAIKTEGILLIKAFGLHEDINWEDLAPYEKVVDYFLFDTSSAQYGGTGKTFDWALLNKYPYSTPYFLSGGLDLENLHTALAISDARLIGLDLNSKFEIESALKDINKIKQALKIIKDE